MKRIRVIHLLMFLLALWGCRKRDYPEEQVFVGEEKFHFEGNVGDEPFVIKAGRDGYYCCAYVQSKPDSIYSFVGELKKVNCDPCPNSLKLEIRDYKKRAPGESTEPDLVFAPGAFVFASRMELAPTFIFSPSFNRNALSYEWSFGDGQNSVERNPSHTFTGAGEFKVGVTITSDQNCINTVSNTLLVFADGNYFFSSIGQVPVGGRGAAFSALVDGGQAPFTYQWHFGDGATSDQANPAHEYQYPGGYPVKLVVTDAKGRKVVSEYNFVTGNDASSCAANFSLTHLLTAKPEIFKTVTLTWIDGEGRVFSSDVPGQQSSSRFEIIKTERFSKNIAGDPTLLLTVRVDAQLSDGTEIRRIKCENAVLGVAYK